MSCPTLVSWRPFRSAYTNRRYQPYKMFCLGSISRHTWLLQDSARHKLENTGACWRSQLGWALTFIDHTMCQPNDNSWHWKHTVDPSTSVKAVWVFSKFNTFPTHMHVMPLSGHFYIPGPMYRHTLIMSGCSCSKAVNAMLNTQS